MRAQPLLILLVCFVLPGGARLVHAETAPSFDDVQKSFDSALSDDDPVVRAGAFELLRDVADPRAVDLILKGGRMIRSQQEKVRKEQVKIEADYEAQFEKKLKADAWFENSSRSSKDLDRYNDAVRKISRKLDALRIQQKSLENDYTRARALLDSASRAMGGVLGRLGPEALGPALDRVTAEWLRGRDEDDRMRWLDALADVEAPTVGERIREVVGDAALDLRLRGAALQTLANRHDAEAFDRAVGFLEGADVPWDLQAAAVDALRRLHERRSIEPLIAFLKREDLKRLREDVTQALRSLTGEKHGPYFDPWNRWWEENRDRFQMPQAPVADVAGSEPQEGVTFYGIHTFSDRVLFILDVSGSMEKAPMTKDDAGQSVPAGPPNIETARKELIGAINNLNPTDRFNVIFFNHQVVLWQPKMVDASEANKRRVAKWVEDQPPLGTTNIYDALEAGFRIALQATGDPLVDTIFFLTDGRPTSGKVQDPERIRDEVLEWNQAAKIRIHCVGIGDHDEMLLEALARASGGTYVKK